MDATDRLGLPFPEIGIDPPNGAAQIQALAEALDALITPSGTLQATARASAPTGWLICDGTAVSRATYADLFTAIGTTYGAGNGTTTFNIPDLRGRVPIGVDGAAGRISNDDALGDSSGFEGSTLDASSMPTSVPVQISPAAITSAATPNTGGLNVPQTTFGWTSGAGQEHYNLQPYQVVNWMIRT